MRAEYEHFYDHVRAGLPEFAPCYWLDPVTKQCRHYEHRPQVCRDFELGGDACLGHRKRAGMPV